MIATDAYKVTWLIRRLFRAMAELADDYLKDADLTAADRAVLEFLYPDGALSVPDIARRYQVTRQHIQVTANGLIEAGLLTTATNPRHKRSPLLRLSDAGREAFAAIRERESQLLEAWFADIQIADVATTKRTLETLLERLRQETHHA